jgi:O-methyltransferase
MLSNVLKHIVRRLTRRGAGDPPAVERRPGSWHHADLEWLAGLAADVPGDFAEIGVFRGAAFRHVAALAYSQERMAHAFDIFKGGAPPQAEDGDQYPAGKFDIGGPEAFLRLMDQAGVSRDAYRVWAGFVPACFKDVPDTLRFAFAILDVDHYQPTVDGLRWLAPRMSPGGILALDDFLESHTILASKAIKEFLAGKPDFDVVAQFNQQLILRKR